MAQKHNEYKEQPMTRAGTIQGPSRRYRRLRHPNFPAAEWAAKNPLLQRGELGIEKDTHKMKAGDGVTYWNDLPYMYDDAGQPLSTADYQMGNASGGWTTMSEAQQDALNSGATTTNIGQIATNTNDIATNKGIMDDHIANTSNPHSVTKAQVGLGNVDNTADLDKPISTATQNALDNKVDKNAAITGATKCKITYDSKGLVTGGADLGESDIPALHLSKISDVTATAAEVNVLDGITATTTELNYTDGVTSNIQTQLNGKTNYVVANELPEASASTDGKVYYLVISAGETQPYIGYSKEHYEEDWAEASLETSTPTIGGVNIDIITFKDIYQMEYGERSDEWFAEAFDMNPTFTLVKEGNNSVIYWDAYSDITPLSENIYSAFTFYDEDWEEEVDINDIDSATWDVYYYPGSEYTEYGWRALKTTNTVARWGYIQGTINSQTDLKNALDAKQDTISDLADIRSGAEAGATAVQPSDLATVATSGSYTDLSNKPTIGDATLTIQKNGTNVDTFTANATSNKTINITVPVTAADVNALPDSTKYVANASMTINSSTYVVTLQLKDQDGNNIGTAQTVDLPLESMVVSGSYDDATKKIILTLQNGQTIEFSVADLVSGLQTEITANNMLDADLVDDSTSTNKFVTASDITTWNGKQDALTAGSNITISGATISATDTTYTGSDGITLTGTNFTNSGVRSVATGSTNGTISVNTGGTTADVAVTGLGSAAYTASADYATSAQGAKADTAVQPGDLATVATTGDYGDLLNKPTIPTVNDATLTIQKNGTTVNTFTANASSNVTANITVPTTTNDLTNNSGFITSSDIPVTDVTVGGTSVVSSGVAAVPAIPTVNDATITITQGGVTKGSFTLNQASGDTIALDAGGGGSSLDAGMLVPFANTAVPAGWLVCDGSAISRTDYSGLFAAIGTTYGTGDGSTTFNLPDLSDKLPLYNSGATLGGTTNGKAPNISGRVGPPQGDVQDNSSGAFYLGDTLASGPLAKRSNQRIYTMDASRCSAVYDNNATGITPAGVYTLWCIKY